MQRKVGLSYKATLESLVCMGRCSCQRITYKAKRLPVVRIGMRDGVWIG